MNSILEYHKRLLDKALQSPVINEREVDQLQKNIFEAQSLLDNHKDYMDKLKTKQTMSKVSGEYSRIIEEKRQLYQIEKNVEALNEQKRKTRDEEAFKKELQKREAYRKSIEMNNSLLQKQILEKRLPLQSDLLADEYEKRTKEAENKMDDFMKSARQQSVLEMKDSLHRQLVERQAAKDRLEKEKIEERNKALIITQNILGEDNLRRQQKAKTMLELQEMYEQQIKQKNSSVIYAGYPRYDTEFYRNRRSPFSMAASHIIA